uniref:Uncharacterized protein n=1 Tax=Rhizophora mucronata TaxID=61149 RepID=A0A2P2PE41_RHIMU
MWITIKSWIIGQLWFETIHLKVSR